MPSNTSPFDAKPTQPQVGTILATPKVLTRLSRSAMDSLKMYRPWSKFFIPRQPERILMLAKRHYKMYVNVNFTPFSSHRVLTVIVIEAGPYFIRAEFLGVLILQNVSCGPLPDICDANNHPPKMVGTVQLSVQLGRYSACCEFIVCKTFAASAVLGTDFCDRFVKAIFPKKRVIELDDGTPVLIIRRPLKLVGRGIQPPLLISLEDTTQRPESRLWLSLLRHSLCLHTLSVG